MCSFAKILDKRRNRIAIFWGVEMIDRNTTSFFSIATLSKKLKQLIPLLIL